MLEHLITQEAAPKPFSTFRLCHRSAFLFHRPDTPFLLRIFQTISCRWDSGNDGIIAFKSKTRLLKHYQEKLGAVHIGNHNMIIYPEKALILINKYFKD